MIQISRIDDFESFGKMLTFQNAWVTPYRRIVRDGRRRLTGGFQVPESTPERFLDVRWLPNPEPFANDRPSAEPGCFLYGGLFDPHFGHFMEESIHRLWAWNHTGREYDGLVFAPVPRFRPNQNIPEFVQQTLAWFQIPIERVLFTYQPRRFEVLHVPEVGRTRKRTASDSYTDILSSVLILPKPRGEGARIYLSRSRLSWEKGKILGEYAIEQWLIAEGYDIIYPEQITLEEQISRYRGAAEIIVSGGSAINGLQLIPNLSARVALIQRHPREARLWQDRVSAGGYVNAIDWADGFATANRYASALDPNALISALSQFWDGQPTSSLDLVQFREQEFNDFVTWFRSNATDALPSGSDTKSKAQRILQGYFSHLKRQGGPTPGQRSTLHDLISVYGNNTALD